MVTEKKSKRVMNDKEIAEFTEKKFFSKKQKLPKWFNGELYEKGEVVTNPFSKKDYPLNGMELSMYDYIMGCNLMIEARGGVFNPATAELQRGMAKGLGWFRNNNAKAYMVLLD